MLFIIFFNTSYFRLISFCSDLCNHTSPYQFTLTVFPCISFRQFYTTLRYAILMICCEIYILYHGNLKRKLMLNDIIFYCMLLYAMIFEQNCLRIQKCSSYFIAEFKKNVFHYLQFNHWFLKSH